MYKIVGSM